MTWSNTYFWLQLITGIAGAHAAATLAKEHSFGVIGHSLVGAIAGAFSGYFLQTVVGTVVDAAGVPGQGTPVDQAVLQGMAGLAIGAVAVLAIGLVRHVNSQRDHKRG